MSALDSVVDVDAITKKFEELAQQETANFISQVDAIALSYLERLRSRVVEEVGSSVTGFADDLINNLIADFNQRITAILKQKEEEFVKNASETTSQNIHDLGQSASLNYAAKIESVFKDTLRPSVSNTVVGFEQYVSGVVEEQVKGLPVKV